MTKLKPEMEIIYVDSNLVDKTKVVSINKKDGTAKLANGIILNREILKKGYFKRASKRSEAKAFIYDESDNDSKGTKIYKAYICKCQLRNMIPAIKQSIEDKDLILDEGWLREFRDIIGKFIGQ